MRSRRALRGSFVLLAVAACGLGRPSGATAGGSAFGTSGLDAAPTFNAINFTVHVNTGGLAGQAGFLDVKFNPTNTQSVGTASMSVGSFVTDGSVNGVPQTFGDASGSLAGGLSFDNKTQRNGFLQPFLFGQSISFDVGITGFTPGGLAAPTTLSVILVDNSGNLVPFNTGPGGAVVTLDYTFGTNPGATPNVFGPLAAGGPTATVEPRSATPEPATLIPACLAAGAYLCYRWRRPHRGPPAKR